MRFPRSPLLANPQRARAASMPVWAGMLCSVALLPRALSSTYSETRPVLWVPNSRRRSHRRVPAASGQPVCPIFLLFSRFAPPLGDSSLPRMNLVGVCTWCQPRPLHSLLSVRRYEGQLMSVGICGATQTWDSLDEEDLSTLDNIDTTCGLVGDCGETTCGATQARCSRCIRSCLGRLRSCLCTQLGASIMEICSFMQQPDQTRPVQNRHSSG